MKFGKIVLLGTILACSAPFAAATPVYGSITTSGTGTITFTSAGTPAVRTPTGISYASTTFLNQVNTSADPYFEQSSGAVLGGDGDVEFRTLLPSANMHYATGATSTTLTANHLKYAASVRTKASFTFPATLGSTLAPPIEFYEIRQGTEILDLFITEVDTTAVGRNPSGTGIHHIDATSGGFTGIAYVTTDGGVTKTYGDFTLTLTAGGGQEGFTTHFVAYTPEPSSLALLGTGMLSIAGMGFRKLRGTV